MLSQKEMKNRIKPEKVDLRTNAGKIICQNYHKKAKKEKLNYVKKCVKILLLKMHIKDRLHFTVNYGNFDTNWSKKISMANLDITLGLFTWGKFTMFWK